MATLSWTGEKQTSDWSNPGNWSPNRVPQDGDSIVVPASDPYTTPAPLAPAFRAEKLDVSGNIFGGPITVTDAFTWTSSGYIGASLVLQGDSKINVTGPDMRIFRAASIQAQAGLSITGGNTLGLAEMATVTVSGTLEVRDGTGLQHMAGGCPTLTTTGTFAVRGGTSTTRVGGIGCLKIHASGVLEIDGGTLLIGGTNTLEADGLTIQGGGNLVIGDQDGGALLLDSDSRLSEHTTLTLTGRGSIRPARPPLKTPKLTIDGTFEVATWDMQVDLDISAKGRVNVNGDQPTGLIGVQVSNAGMFSVQQGAQLTITNGTVVANSGRLVLHENVTVNGTGGKLQNKGLVVKIGAGLTTLVDLEVVNDSGAIVLRGDQLSLAGLGSFVQNDGQVLLDGGNLQGVGALQINDGLITGHGLVDAIVQNGGWIEPRDPGLTVRTLNQLGSGNVVMPPTIWNDGAPPSLMITQSANLDGSFWTTAMAAAPVPGPTGVLIGGNGNINGRFRRVRAAWESLRLYLQTAMTVSGTLVAVPQVSYGLDRTSFPDPGHVVAGMTGDQLMQQLFENTPFAFVGVYIAPAVCHHDDSWLQNQRLALLTEQGWGVIPFYVGRQMPGTSACDQAPGPDAAAAGTADADEATNAAAAGGLPNNGVIYLDVEDGANPQQQDMLDYVDAWIARVRASQYLPGIYCLASAAEVYHNAYPDMPLCISRNYYGDHVLDGNGEIRTIDLVNPNDPHHPENWEFVAYAQDWQFSTDYQAGWSFLDDRGSIVSWNEPLDFNVSRGADPSRPAAQVSKVRTVVSQLDVEQNQVAGGDSSQLWIQIDRTAARPDGVVVLIRSSVGEAILPSRTRVPPGATRVGVQVRTVPVEQTVTASITARTLRQTDATPPSAALTINPR